MTNRTLMFKVLYTASTLAGTMLVGLPAYAQISGSGVVVAPPSAPPVIQVPAAPIYAAKTAPGALVDAAAFTAWAGSSGVVQAGVGPLAPTPDPQGASQFIEYRFSVTDVDGSADIKDAQARLLRPDGSVHTDFAPAISLGTSSNITKEYYAKFELKSTDPPATGADFYKLVVKVADAAIQSGSLPYVDNAVTPGLFQYTTLANLRPVVDDLNFGALQANGKSAGVPVSLVNLGNVPADSTLSATDFTKGSDVIPASKIWYGPTAAAAGTNFPAAGANAKRDAGFNLAPGGTRTAYIAIDVPAGTPTGAYATIITFGAAKHTGAACGSDCANVNWS